MKFHTLAEWLAWQEQLHPSEIELGLERVKSVARQFPFFHPEKKPVTIIVGGTNGKGSCVAYLEAILLAAGYRVGAYSSPHLLIYNERVRIDGQFASDDMFCKSFQRVDQARKSVNHSEVSLTYFEFGTLAALDIFFNEKVDIQILEVGLGGRLDAVNIMEPDAAVVVNVALDHEVWLGDNREAIGHEKAGIFRRQIPLVIGEVDPPDSLLKMAHALQNKQLYIYGKQFSIEETVQDWHFRGTLLQSGEKLDWPRLPKGKLPLPSAACAIQLVNSLELADRYAVEQGLQNATLQGRCQRVEWQDRQIILDVAHNPAGAHYLCNWLTRNLDPASMVNLAVVFSALSDKDHRGAIAELASITRSWYLAPLPVSRGESLKNLLESVARVGGKAQGFDTIGAALYAAVEGTRRGEPILVCGSFYTVAEAFKTIHSGEK